MPPSYLLDTGPLGLLAHARPIRRTPLQLWLVREMTAGARIYLSEVADYEVRRELTRLIRARQLPQSRLQRLDQFASLCSYLPVSTAMWRRAAEFWADARLHGLPTGSGAALDADVLIAAQAAEVGATVVTMNVGHLTRWVPVYPWP